MRAGNTEVGLARVSASPVGSSADVASAVAKSYTGQRWSHIKDQLDGKVRLFPRAHRIKMVDAIALVLRKLRNGSAFLSVDADGAFHTMGNVSGGFVFCEHPSVIRDVSRMGNSELASSPALISVNAPSETAMRAQSAGRGTEALISDARHAAFRAATDDAVFTSRTDAVALLKRVCGARRPPEYDALQTGVLSGEQLLQVAESLNPGFTGALSRIEESLISDRKSGAAIDGRARVAYNQALRNAVREAWSALLRTDFRDDCPHFAYIYIVLLTMTAKQWRDECSRCLVRGERISLVFGDDLPIGYRVLLSRMTPLAETATDAELLTASYVGQEHRGAKSATKCARWLQHTTRQGSHNICQFKFVTNRRNGFVFQPLGDVSVEVRFASMLPGGDTFASRINGAEALAFEALNRVPGFVGVNDSPPGEDCRLLVPTWAGPPRIFGLCEALVTALGGEEKAAKVKLCDAIVSEHTGSFVRDVLETVHTLMENGHYVDSAGNCLKPDFSGGTRRRFSKFSVHTLVTAVFGSIDVDGSSASPQREYTIALWCDACTCHYVGPLCKHLLAGRILRLVQKLPPLWHGSAEALYWGAGPTPSYAVRTCLAPLEASCDLRAEAEAEAVAAEDLPVLYATLGHHLALIACRVASGDADAMKLTDVESSLRGLVRRAEVWSGAHLAEPGGGARRGGRLGKFQKRAGTAGEVDADRAMGPQLREALLPAARLDLLVKAYPLPQLALSASHATLVSTLSGPGHWHHDAAGTTDKTDSDSEAQDSRITDHSNAKAVASAGGSLSSPGQLASAAAVALSVAAPLAAAAKRALPQGPASPRSDPDHDDHVTAAESLAGLGAHPSPLASADSESLSPPPHSSRDDLAMANSDPDLEPGDLQSTEALDSGRRATAGKRKRAGSSARNG